MKVTVIDAGCAECHWGDEPLIEMAVYESVEEVKAEYEQQGWAKGSAWKPHPQGGEHFVHGQGSVWILPNLQEDG